MPKFIHIMQCLHKRLCVILVISLFLFSHLSISAKRILFYDNLTRQPIDFVWFSAMLGSTYATSAHSDKEGSIELNFNPKSTLTDIRIQRTGYGVTTIHNSTLESLPDTIFMHQNMALNEVTIETGTKLYSQDGAKMIYHVANDSSMQNATGYEALKRIPALEVGGWNVSAINGKKLTFLLNGARDLSLRYSTMECLFKIQAKRLKQIEVTDDSLSSEVKVNIVAKNGILAFSGDASIGVDDYCRSITVIPAWRTGRLNFWSNVGFIDMRPHTTTTDDQQTWADSGEISQTTRRTVNYGESYKALRIEPKIEYAINENASFIASYRHFRYLNGSNNESTYEGEMLNADNDTIASYSAHYNNKSYKNYENDVILKYLHELGREGSDGNFSLTYDFYNRESRNSIIQTYDKALVPSAKENKDIASQFFNFNDSTKYKYARHSLRASLNRKIGFRHSIYGAVSMQHTSTSYASDRFDTFVDNETGSREYDFYFSQSKQYLEANLTYSYFSRKMSLTAGGKLAYQHNKLNYSNAARLNRSHVNFLPYVNISAPLMGNAIKTSLTYDITRFSPGFASLNPHVYNNTPGRITYGNMHLNPELDHNASLSAGFSIGKYNTRLTLSGSASNNMLEQYRFLNDNLLHVTYGNVGKKRGAKLTANASGELTGDIYANISGSIGYNDLRSTNMPDIHNYGFFGSIRGNMSVSLPYETSLQLEASYGTSAPLLQGSVNGHHRYGISLSKSIGVFDISAYANNIFYTHQNSKSNLRTSNFAECVNTRSYVASFGISIYFVFAGRAYHRRFDRMESLYLDASK